MGLRSDLPEPVDLREAAEPESLPEEETKARAHLKHLHRQGGRVIVEVIPEQHNVKHGGVSLCGLSIVRRDFLVHRMGVL
ncbi:hypothetical protein M3G46_08625 [Corynebacterium sanguinis]|uniref:hypothetical protein n=1 Tax=Corynebacterium sanguinis TaxID=2594913 RepID=UPI0021A3038A|nr:hypothetical protein [Corynebacterium sanguinis]MCT2252632.1 hypothetical protein [Corynebacterium sanguinis]